MIRHHLKPQQQQTWSLPSFLTGGTQVPQRRAVAPGTFWFSWCKLTCCRSSQYRCWERWWKTGNSPSSSSAACWWRDAEFRIRRRGSRGSSSPAPCPCGDPQRRCLNAGEESLALSPCSPVKIPCKAASAESLFSVFSLYHSLHIHLREASTTFGCFRQH